MLEQLSKDLCLNLSGKNREEITNFALSEEGTLKLFKWKLFSNLAKSGSTIDLNNETVLEILSDQKILTLLLCSGYIIENQWKEAIEILAAILEKDLDARSRFNLKLAVAISITFARPINSLAVSTNIIDYYQRYQSYVRWLKEGVLFPAFETLTVWQLCYVVGSWATDEELEWARANVPTDFKTADKIGEATHSMVSYREYNDEGVSVQKQAEYYKHQPYTLQVMKEMGAVCGGISKFGTAMSQAHGVPAMPVGQPEHCAFLWCKNGEWVISNSVSAISSTNAHSGIRWTWKEGVSYVLLMEAAQKQYARYNLSEKMRIAARFTEANSTFDVLVMGLSECFENFSIWKDMAKILKDSSLCKHSSIVNQFILDVFKLKQIVPDVALGTEVCASDSNDLAKNVVDGTNSSLWWTSEKTAWIEITFPRPVSVEQMNIKWWGISVSRSYKVFAMDDADNFIKVRETEDEMAEPVGYNAWSELPGWDIETTRVRIELDDGTLDPWQKGKWFGIRQIVINGKSIYKVSLLNDKCIATTPPKEDSINVDVEEAFPEMMFEDVYFVDHLELQWCSHHTHAGINIQMSVDETVEERRYFFKDKHSNKANDQIRLKKENVGCVVRKLQFSFQSDERPVPCFHMNCKCLLNVSVFGYRCDLVAMMKAKAGENFENLSVVKDDICEMLDATDYDIVSFKKPCTVSEFEECALCLTDGTTNSLWWASNETAWITVDLEEQYKITNVKIHWWGISVSHCFRVLISKNGTGDFDLVKSNSDAIQAPSSGEYNSWTVISGWNSKTQRIKLELENGCVDPWNKGKYFGIRELIVNGKIFEENF